MPTIAERLETATDALEAAVGTLSTGVNSATASAATATTKAADAETARAAAVVAKTAAETAETNAETAETNAETAEAAAAVSQGAAATSATAAGVSAGAAAASQAAAATSATNAGNSATAAAASQTAAAASATAASGSATTAGTSAATATTQAGNAATSAAAAAASATSALNAIANGFLGGVAGVSVPATAASAGNYYRITTAGTSQSKTWAVGDLAIYNGSSGSWTQISGNITDPASLANKVIPLAPRGGIALDNTSSCRAQASLTNQNLGTDPFTLVLAFRVPLTAPTEEGYGAGLMCLGPVTTDTLGGSASAGFGVLITDTGRLMFGVQNSTSYKYDGFNNFVSTYGGKEVLVCVVRDGTTAVPLLYINGVLTATTNQANSGAITYADSITTTYCLIGLRGTNTATTSNFVGKMRFCSIYNLALTLADILEIYEMNGAVPERFKFGSETELITGTTDRDFSGAGNWTAFNGAGVAVSGGTLNVTSGSANNGAKLDQSYFSGTPSNSTGSNRRFRLKFDITAAASAVVRAVAMGAGSVSQVIASGLGVAAGYSYEFITNNPWNNTATLFFDTASTFSIDNVSLKQLGAVCHWPLDDGYGLQLQDVSTNKLHAFMTVSGVSHVLPDYRPAHVRGSTSTNGNQQLAGATILKGPSQVLKIRARSLSGTPTVTMGTSSGGSQLVASVALSTTWKNLTIALTDGYLSADAALWIGSNSTDVVEIDISLEPLSS